MHSEGIPQPVVYIIQAEHGGPLKIGYCTDKAGVPSRLASLQTGNPHRLIVRRVIDAPRGRVEEAEWHERLAQYRLIGEWFMDAPEVAMATGTGLPRTRDDGKRYLPAIKAAFLAGVEHGRRQAEVANRENMKTFFRLIVPWMYGDDEPDEDVITTEEALRAIGAHKDIARTLDRPRTAHAA